MAKYLKSIAIERPLVFLCGVSVPDSDEGKSKDRRKILEKYIVDNSIKYNEHKNLVYQVMPIIVDNIFSDEIVETENLSLALLEEIMSAISFKTYIFLDSMSTSYELGLFTNSKSNNDVTIFVDKQYKKRQNCPVGEYITKAHKKFIKYTAEYDEKEHIFFKDNIIPDNIKNKITKDLIDIKQNKLSSNITFIKEEPAIQEFSLFSYTTLQNKLKFHFDVKTLFYLLNSIIHEEKIEVLNNSTAETIDNKIRNHLFYNFTEISNDINVEMYKYHKPSIDFVIRDYEKDNIIKHIFWLIRLIKIHNLKNKKEMNYRAITINSSNAYKYKKTSTYFIDYEKNFNQLFNLSIHDYKLIDNYKENSKPYIRKFYMKVHKKIRSITTYANNQKGKKLRELHCRIQNILEGLLPTSEVSFAYKKDYNILMCLKKHYNSTYFYKLDISNFFDSIKKNILSRIISNILFTKLYTSYHLTDRGMNKTKFHKPIAGLLNVCFLNGKLPIGFVTSPKLSDIFLYDLDESIRNQKEVIITRYADDFLISSSCGNNGYVEKTVNLIKELLEKKKLCINNKKIYKRQFIKQGDSIKFLGANIVYVNEKHKNKITISHKYIIETSKLIQNALFKKDKILMEQCEGRCNYIKNINLESFNKLEVIFNKHTKKSLSYEMNKFK